MRKLFTLACAAIFSVGLMADDATLVLNNGATSTPANYFTVAKGESDPSYNTNYTGVYAGITFTKGLKMESATTVTFTTASVSNIIIVQSTAKNGDKTIKFDNNELSSGKTDVEGTTTCRVYTLENVAKGDHTISRGSGESGLLYVAVADARKIVSTTETLKAVAINNVAISETNFNKLVAQGEIILEDSYVTAPVVKFTKHVVVKYDDDTTKESDEDIEKTSTVASAGTWGASASIGGETYAVYTVKISSYNVNYYDGATKLGTEVVAQNGTAVKHDEFAVKPLYQFINWYTDAELTHVVESWTITSDNVNFYGKWEKAYATSLDIENFVLANGMDNADADHIGDVFKGVLAGAFYAHTDINALDTLNDLDKKDNRNYAFLGLKIKKTAGHLDFNLKKGSTVKIRFGNVGASFVIKINGVDSTLTNAVANATVSSNKVFEYEASEADALIQIFGCANNKTLVIKQIKINEQISPVNLPDPSAYAVKVTADKGTVTAKVNDAAYDLSAKNVLIGASVELTVAANQGFVIKEVTVNGVPANLTEGKYTFTMPAEEVAFVATFEAEATALDNTEASVKATKRIVNGMLLIEKNGEVYNVLGTRVR